MLKNYFIGCNQIKEYKLFFPKQVALEVFFFFPRRKAFYTKTISIFFCFLGGGVRVYGIIPFENGIFLLQLLKLRLLNKKI